MQDNRTSNKNYPLPHPENIASQDVGRIADAISMIDGDVNACDEAIESLENTVSALDERSLRIPQTLVGTVNTELQDLEPNRYIVVNGDGSGFSTVEGGGGEGGLRGEILVKRSNSNFDTMWVDPKALYKRAITINESNSDFKAKNNNVVILAEEIEIDNGDELPRLELTQRQTNVDTTGDSQYSYIIADEVEEHGDDHSDIASKTNFGRVKIGDGIALDNGTISVTEYPKCSKTNHGIVKIGDGINVEDGVISSREYPLADYDNFGLVKLSSDFSIASEGALILAGKKDVEEIIYQAANICVANNNCVILDPEYAKYRLFINEDSLITFDWSTFIQEKDLAFELEIISEHFYTIEFDANIEWTLPCTGVSPGTTIIEFRKLLGSSTLFATIKDTDTLPKICLTIEATDDIQDNYICYTNGLSWNACSMLTPRGDYGWWNETSFNSGSGEGTWNIDFAKSTCLTSLYWQGSNNQLAYFYLEGSNDKQTWIKVITKENDSLPRGYIDCIRSGCFRHYRIRTVTGFVMNYFQLYGFQVGKNRILIEKIIPEMTANSLDGYVLTSSGTNDGALFNLTANSTGSFANFNTRDANSEYWIKYELPEAAIVNMIDIGACTGESNRMPLRFKILASNDNTNWNLLLEGSSLVRWYDGETRQYYLTNTTAYKYYKFIPIELQTSEFRIARLRLYKVLEH